jgi:hypothetical protein
MDYKKWAKAAGIRCLKTAAQTAMGMIAMGKAMEELNWYYILSVVMVASILSLLTSIYGLPETSTDVQGQLTVYEDDIDGGTCKGTTTLNVNDLNNGKIIKLKVKNDVRKT